MGLIPVGNAGFRVPSGAPTPRIDRVPSVGDAIAEAGGAGLQIADQMQRENAQALRDTTAVMQEQRREQNALERQELAELKAARRTRAQLDASNTGLRAEGDMANLETGLATRLRAGEIDHDGYVDGLNKGIEQIRGAALKGADPEWAPLVERSLIGAHHKVETTARATVIDVAKRDVLAKVVEAGELLQRAAVSDPELAIRRADALYEGAKGTIGADAAAKGKATFREQAWRSHYLRQIEDNRDNPGGLAALRDRVTGASALDPNQQTALLTAIDNRQTMIENRARAALERRDRKSEQAFTALQALDAQGLPGDPAFVSATMAALKGTPYEEAARQIISGSAATAKFGALPVAEQDAVLAAEYAKAGKDGVTPASQKRLQKLEGVRNASIQAYKADPWQAGVERGQIDPPAPLDLSNPEAMLASFTDRMAQAPTLDRLAGRQVSPLRPAEATLLGDMLDRMPIPERTRFLGGIGKVIGGRRLEDLSRQLGAKNNSLGIAAAMEANQLRSLTGRSVAEMFLAGEDAIKTGTVKIDAAKETGLRAEIFKEIGDAYTTPAARDAAADVAMKLWASQKADGQSPSVDGVVRLATGGIMEINKRKTPMPYGWTEDETRHAINRVGKDQIVAAAGGDQVRVGDALMSASDLAAQMSLVQLRSAGSNRYVIQLGNQLVTRANGQPFAISLVKP